MLWRRRTPAPASAMSESTVQAVSVVNMSVKATASAVLRLMSDDDREPRRRWIRLEAVEIWEGDASIGGGDD
jgi:hypothetical protein